eukprot:12444524-Heterocapsa_arctica.AAC.1
MVTGLKLVMGDWMRCGRSSRRMGPERSLTSRARSWCWAWPTQASARATTSTTSSTSRSYYVDGEFGEYELLYRLRALRLEPLHGQRVRQAQ